MPPLLPAMAWSAGDVEVVTDLHDAAGHPRGADHRVAFGPGTDVPAQCHRVAAGVHGDVAVVVDQRIAVQCVLHQPGHVDRVGVVTDVDVVLDAADAGQPGDRPFGRLTLPAVLHRAGQRQVAVTCGRLDAVRHRDVQRQRVVRRGGQYRVVAVVLVGQDDLQVIVDARDAGHALSGGGGLHVLRIARDGAVESRVPVDVHDMNVRVVDERVELELCLDCREDVCGGAHCCAPFPEWI